jgi:hypothetical protein
LNLLEYRFVLLYWVGRPWPTGPILNTPTTDASPSATMPRSCRGRWRSALIVSCGVCLFPGEASQAQSVVKRAAILHEIPASTLGQTSLTRVIAEPGGTAVVVGHGRTPVIRVDSRGGVRNTFRSVELGEGPGFLRAGRYGSFIWIQRSTGTEVTLLGDDLSIQGRIPLGRSLILSNGDPAPVGGPGTMGGAVLQGFSPQGHPVFSALLSRGLVVPPGWGGRPRSWDLLLQVDTFGIVQNVVAWGIPAGVCRIEGMLLPFCQTPVQAQGLDHGRFAEVDAALSGPDSGYVSVVLLSTSGDTLARRRFSFVGEHLSLAQQDSVRSRLLELPGVSRSPARLGFVRDSFVPTTHPPVRGAFFDAEGQLWVQLHMSGQYQEYAVLASDGTDRGRVQVPRGVRVQSAGGEILWGFREGAGPPDRLVILRR